MRVSLGDCVDGTDDVTFQACDTGDTGAPLTVFTPSTLCQTSDCLMTGAPLTSAQSAQLGVQPASGASASGSSNPITALLASLTSAASGAVKAAVTPAPYVLPGTNTLYNPATGQIVGSVNSAGVLTTGTTAGISGVMLLALAAVAIFAMRGK